ncbi:MAG: hypothetical protein IPN17_37265 [Deltaproteobacteria bacterium]|nr:hypothetical protein [Deltaproteobacteria bacterium]
MVFRLRVLDAPGRHARPRGPLREPPRLNGSGLLHGAFTTCDDGIYLTAALPARQPRPPTSSGGGRRP